jgi:uncharacterized phage-like protein YoqJ
MAKTVCFTGHRQIPEDDLPRLSALLREVVEAQIAQGATVFRTGGALGFDTLAALTVLALRRIYPHIRLELYLPCPTQTRGWSASDRRLYTQILEQADAYHYASTGYYAGVLQARNRALVEDADLCVAYLTHHDGGGTVYTVQLALKKQLEFINLQDLLKENT